MRSTDALNVHPSNAGALEAWDGADGDYWTEQEAVFEHCLHRYMPAFFAAARVSERDRVLDIGCGTGGTTLDAARRARAGTALGVDLSSRMIERARQRANEEGIANATFLQADAQIHPFEDGAGDVVISRTGAMFFGDPHAAFTNIGRALRPGGRIVLLVWQSLAQNHWIRDFSAALAAGREQPEPPPDAPGPFSLSDPDRVRSILSSSGFVGVDLEGAKEPMWFGETAASAFRFVRGLGVTEFMLRDLDDTVRARALDDLRATIDAHETSEGVLYPSATWLVTARRP